MTAPLYVLKRHDEEEPEIREIPFAWDVLISIGSMVFACLLVYLMYRVGAGLWHGLVAIGSKLEELI